MMCNWRLIKWLKDAIIFLYLKKFGESLLNGNHIIFFEFKRHSYPIPFSSSLQKSIIKEVCGSALVLIGESWWFGFWMYMLTVHQCLNFWIYFFHNSNCSAQVPTFSCFAYDYLIVLGSPQPWHLYSHLWW